MMQFSDFVYILTGKTNRRAEMPEATPKVQVSPVSYEDCLKFVVEKASSKMTADQIRTLVSLMMETFTNAG